MLSSVVRAKTLSTHTSFILASLLFEARGSRTPVHWGSMVGILERGGERTLVKGISIERYDIIATSAAAATCGAGQLVCCLIIHTQSIPSLVLTQSPFNKLTPFLENFRSKSESMPRTRASNLLLCAAPRKC